MKQWKELALVSAWALLTVGLAACWLYRSYARSYITKMATTEDLDELVKLIDERKELNSN